MERKSELGVKNFREWKGMWLGGWKYGFEVVIVEIMKIYEIVWEEFIIWENER